MSLDRLTTALADRYRIERQLGAGGMATVYLAHDVRHDRKVALKVLRPELSAILGAERFLHEIKTTANLQHPHIVPLHDSGEAEGQVYYVMPYVEGESLRDRLERERQLPVDEAIRIAAEVADGLHYAHQQKIVHRDIKPENILLHGGHAQIADFGIALAAAQSTGGHRMTETGMSLGTPHYMSPEQAMGEREITPRSDIYALGVILYEMLTGEPPFNGATAQAVFARVLTEPPRPITLQRHTVPPHVEGAILQALEKLPADRFATAADFAKALVEGTAQGRHDGRTVARTAAARPLTRRESLLRSLPLVAALLFAALATWGWLRARALADRPTHWEYISLGDSLAAQPIVPSLALSPDGRTLVFKDDVLNGLLWVKRDEALDPVAIPGTERASNPAFSPDGEWVVFVADGELRKVRVSTGAVLTLADSAANGFGGAAWLDDGTIVYTSPDLTQLRRVSSVGGTGTTVLTNAGMQGAGVGYPTPLPDSRGVLFMVCTSGCVTQSLRVLDLRTGTEKLLVREAGQGWYLPTGHLLYFRRDGTGMAAPFDLDRLELTGAAVPVLQRVQVGNGFAQLTLSRSGSVVYLSGGSATGENSMVRVDRRGVLTTIDSTLSGPFNSFALAPGGRRLAIGVGAGTGSLNIWIKELDRGPLTRLTFGGADRRPAWSPDGRMIAFIRDTLGTSYVAGRFVDGSRPDTVLVRASRQLQAVEWSSDGRWLIARTDNGEAGAGDVVGYRVGGDTAEVPLAASSFSEISPSLSPDGRWLAYASNESGQFEVYVRPFPNTADGRWQVSTEGGGDVRWSPGGSELYYLDNPGNLMAVPVRATPTFVAGTPVRLFDASTYYFDGFHHSYDVTPDGRFFIFAAPRLRDGGRTTSLIRVDRWFQQLQSQLEQ